MVVKVNGQRRYLWRAVDHEGEVLESYVTTARDKVAALEFIKKAMKRHHAGRSAGAGSQAPRKLPRMTEVRCRFGSRSRPRVRERGAS